MSDTYLTRQTLLKRLKSPEDELSWEEFIEYYRHFIFAIINKMAVPECDQDEVFQLTTIRLWKAMPNFDYTRSKGHFRNWLYTVVKNSVYKYFGSDNKKNLEEFKVDSIGEVSPEIDDIIEKEWDKHILTMAFDSVAKKISSTAMDAFIQGLDGESAEDAAKRLGLSESSIYVYRKRVKEALSDEVKNLKEMLE